MIRRIHLLLAILTILTMIFLFKVFTFLNTKRLTELNPPRSAPEFVLFDQSSWLNSPPLQLSGLKGKVILLFVWTFD